MDPEFNRNNVTLNDFREKILGDYLKLTNAISQNQSEILCEKYRDSYQPSYIEIDRFIDDIKYQERELNSDARSKKEVRVFQTQ